MKKKISIFMVSLSLAVSMGIFSMSMGGVSAGQGVSVDRQGNEFVLKEGPGGSPVQIYVQPLDNEPKEYSESIIVTLNGEKITFDVQPQLINNRTMVPLRKIFEAMGADVAWDENTQTVTATKGNERVIATIDSKNVYINGETKTLDVPPMIVNDRTLVPVRFVAEAFGANVDWDESTQTVIIMTNQQNENSTQPIVIELLGWKQSTLEYTGDNVIYYAVKVTNQNNNYAYRFPSFNITIKDSDGKILKTQKQVLNYIAADDVSFYGNSLSYSGDSAYEIEVSPNYRKEDFIKQNDSLYIKTSDFIITNVYENKTKYDKLYTGEVFNNSDVDCKGVAITVIYKSNGSIVGGNTTYIDSLNAKSKNYFEIAHNGVIDYDSYEIYAQPWS